jgi:PhzF family phenazine biosynthesis protein
VRIACFQIDAFTKRPFAGNPAAVCPLEAWVPDELMQAIAAENALSETAFFVRRTDGDFDLRWFTPAVEVDLCGHATLASGLVVLDALEPERVGVRFHTRSGPLDVVREQGRFALELPARPPVGDDSAVDALARALGRRPQTAARARDLVAVYGSAREVRELAPDMAAVAALDTFAVIATAPGDPDADADFVSRFFAPAKGVPEDPVTGSAHSTLAPYWAERLGRSLLRARQVSVRGGELLCEHRGDRVRLLGDAVLVKTGAFLLPDGQDGAENGGGA